MLYINALAIVFLLIKFELDFYINLQMVEHVLKRSATNHRQIK